VGTHLACQLMGRKAVVHVRTMLHRMHSSNSNIAGDTAAATVPTKATLDKTNGDPISDQERRKEKRNKQTNERTNERKKEGTNEQTDGRTDE